MGLSSRHQQGMISLGGNMTSKEKLGAPLRKIVAIVRNGTSIFDRDRVRLECGHETSSNGQYRARCSKCKKGTCGPSSTGEDKISEPSAKAQRLCAEWLKTCLDLGWPKTALDDLEKLWWKHHDERGNIITDVSPDMGSKGVTDE